jgi:hypothetical protein
MVANEIEDHVVLVVAAREILKENYGGWAAAAELADPAALSGPALAAEGR